MSQVARAASAVLNESDKARLLRAMDYREQPPSPALAGLVKAFWTLEGDGDPTQWIAHEAAPDGCVELVWRLRGRSRWRSDQPETFAVGIADRAAAFSVSGDARFAAVRLWPWAWPALSDIPLARMWDGWTEVTEAPLVELCRLLPDVDAAQAALTRRLADAGGDAMVGRAILQAASVGQMRERTGLGPRALQRWFAARVGMAPSRYLRVLRFQRAFAGIASGDSLAGHAADHGFADQAHMAREFRSLAGRPAREARRRAVGPFLR